MTAPRLPTTISLQTLRDELVFSKTRLLADAQAKVYAKPFELLLTKWATVHARQLELWDAQTMADARIAAADAALDDFIVRFVRVIRALPGGGASAYATYFKKAPSVLAAPVLGDELETVRGWSVLLSKEKTPALKALKKDLDAAIAVADAAIAARATADSENRHFRERGGLADFISDIEKKRLSTSGDLDKLASNDAALPRDFSAGFFRKRTAKVSDEEKKARADAKAARQQAEAAQQAAVAAAQAKVKAALAELKAAKK